MNKKHVGDWNAASESDIYYCYRLLLDREPEPDGWTTFTNNIKSGMSVQDLASSFLNSVEFRNKQASQSSLESTPLLVEADTFKIYVYPYGSPVVRPIMERQQYEPHVVAALRRLLKPGMVFVDVGASFGYLSLVAAQVVGVDGKVICFEPDPNNCKLIYLSARANGLENIEIYSFALADKSKNVIFDSMQGNGAISNFDLNLETTPARFVIRTITLDQALRDENAIDLLKMDVEGAEGLVLQGGIELLRRHRPTIISEFSPSALQNISGVSGEEYLRKLINENYTISVLDFDNQVIDCGVDTAEVIRHFHQRATSHIDILALPG